MTHLPKGEFLTNKRPLARVVDAVSKLTGVTIAEIMGPRRDRHIIRARFAAMAIARDYLNLSYPQIGREFNRDHTSVINAMRRVDALCDDRDLNDLEAIARQAGIIVTAAELRQFVERIETLEAEKQEAAEAQKEVYAEAKGRGYDSAVLLKVVARRKRNRDELAEEEAILEIYEAAIEGKA